MPDDASVHEDPTKATAFTPSSAPRGEDEIPLAPGEEEVSAPSDPHDPLSGIPSVAADIAGEVPESEVTDAQRAKPTPKGGTGQSEHPPASTAP